LYTSDELERLRLIKHLVEDVGVNLAGVQRLLSIAEAVQRLRPARARTRVSAGRPPAHGAGDRTDRSDGGAVGRAA
jgi:DNA-binding transcriptional MerR regulator